MSPRSPRVCSALVAFPLFALGLGCSSTSSSPIDGGAGIVPGDADNHCIGVTPIITSQASCHVGADAAAPGDDGGASDDAGAEEPAPIHSGAESDDDDCKYHVKFSTTPVVVNSNLTFNVTVTRLSDNAPATNAAVTLESYLADNLFHPIPNNGTQTTESPANSGKYVIKPIKFDASGRWIVRFHLYESCDDILEDSPHGHVAFNFDVP
jgi:hypothetical protein